MRFLVVGDSYVPVSVFEESLQGCSERHELHFVQIDESRPFAPATASEGRLREYAGSPHELIEHMDRVEVLVVHGAPVSAEVLKSSTVLRLVCCARGGPVNVDIDAATACRVPVVTTPGKNAPAVAEETIALMIMLARRIPSAQQFLQQGGLLGDSTFEGARFIGHELRGRTLGLVGYGQVGSRVARLAQSFAMHVLVYDPYVELAQETHVAQVQELAELLSISDFVSVHARASPQTENLFGRAEFAFMKAGAYFINTARETLVDETALEDALKQRRLGGVALDVLRPQPGVVGAHPLLRHENVILTPHIGGATTETLRRGANMIAEEIDRFERGDSLQFVVNPEAMAD